MPSIIMERLRQKYRTMSWPDGPAPALPDAWLGLPRLNPERFAAGEPTDYCPTGALTTAGGTRLDVGKCVFCGACAKRGPEGGVEFTRDFAMAAFSRRDLVLDGSPAPARSAAGAERLAEIRSLFGKSLKLREVSAGGCNACEADCNVLGTIAWDMARFGINFVASPRHADGILVTGPVTGNMRLALEKTYAATPAPKVVIAVGACAISGGVYAGTGGDGVPESLARVDMYIPGCPPHPLVILEGLLRLVGRIPDRP